MKLIIAGSRSIETETALGVIHALDRWFSWQQVELVISGCARGVDQAGEEWADDAGIPSVRYPADWDRHGKAAGPIRNEEMAEEGDELLLIWDGESKGSADMKRQMLKKGKPVWEVTLRTPGQVLAAESGQGAAALKLPFD